MADTYIDSNGVERVRGTNMRVSGPSNNREEGYVSTSATNDPVQPTANYGGGRTYEGRETAYVWKDGTTTYSNLTRWDDAAKAAGKEGVGLASAHTYRVNNGKSVSDKPYVSDSSYQPDSLKMAKQSREQLAGVYGVDPWTGEFTGNYAGPDQGYFGEQKRFELPGTATGSYLEGEAAGAAPGTGLTGTLTGANNPYTAMISRAEAENQALMEQIQAMYGGSTEQINAYIDALYRSQESQLEQQRAQIEEQAEEALRQQYVSRETAAGSLGELLGAQGINGGGVESTYADLYAGYQQGRGEILSEQDRAMSDIDAAISQAYADAEAQRYQQLLANDQERNAALMQAYYNNRNYLDSLRESEIAYDLQQQQLAMEREQYQDSLRRQQLGDTLTLAESGLLSGNALYQELQEYGVSPELAAAYAQELELARQEAIREYQPAAGQAYGGTGYASGGSSGGDMAYMGTAYTQNNGAGLTEDKTRMIDNAYRMGSLAAATIPMSDPLGVAKNTVANQYIVQRIQSLINSGQISEDDYNEYYRRKTAGV